MADEASELSLIIYRLDNHGKRIDAQDVRLQVVEDNCRDVSGLRELVTEQDKRLRQIEDRYHEFSAEMRSLSNQLREFADDAKSLRRGFYTLAFGAVASALVVVFTVTQIINGS